MSFAVSAEAGSATPGRLMPLCSPSGPPATTVVFTRRAVRRFDPQLDAPIVEQQAVARAHRCGQPGEGGRDQPGAADRGPGDDVERVAGREACSGAAAFERPVRILGPLRSCRMATWRPARSPAARTRAISVRMLVVRAMREVQPEHVGSRRQ